VTTLPCEEPGISKGAGHDHHRVALHSGYLVCGHAFAEMGFLTELFHLRGKVAHDVQHLGTERYAHGDVQLPAETVILLVERLPVAAQRGDFQAREPPPITTTHRGFVAVFRVPIP
jgi:hypothetical protein